MKGDGEGKMNTVEKQCVVHVCSRPAIVGSSQSLTLLGRIFPLDLNSQFIHISPARDMVKPFFIGSTPSVPLQIRAVNIAIHRAKNGSSKRILISLPPSSSRKMPRSIKAPNDLRTVDGPLPRARTNFIDCSLVPPSVMTRIKVFCWIAVRPFQSWV